MALGGRTKTATDAVQVLAYTQRAIGARRAPLLAVAGLSAGMGLVEAGVLALVAQLAASLTSGLSETRSALGPFTRGGSARDLVVFAGLLAVLRAFLQVVLAWLQARITSDSIARLRNELFDAFASASWTVQALERRGHLQQVFTTQIGNAAVVAQNLSTLLAAAATFFALVLAALVLAPLAALAAGVAAGAVFLGLRPLIGFGKRANEAMVDAELDTAAALHEATEMAEEGHVFGVARQEQERIARLVELWRRASLRARFAGGLSSGTNQSATFLLIVIAVGFLLALDPTDPTVIGAGVLILIRAGMYAQQIQTAHHGIHHLQPVLRSIHRAIDTYRASTTPYGNDRLVSVASVEFRGVGFSYEPEQAILQDVSFRFEKGETIGIVGPSGAGKSTIVQLLLRLRSPAVGEYLVNGRAALEYEPADWAREVSYLGQDSRVFRGTIGDNIRFFRELSDAQVERAARLAGVHDEIIKMPNGYRSVIDQRAVAVSGGQRQRICLARSIAEHPSLLVLDEPTSALDPLAEAAVQESLRSLRGETTIVIVSHRLSTLTICDRVLVLLDGRVDACAPALELLDTSDFFRQAVDQARRA